MTSKVRSLLREEDPAERWLLEAARSETPPRAAMTRAASALGLADVCTPPLSVNGAAQATFSVSKWALVAAAGLGGMLGCWVAWQGMGRTDIDATPGIDTTGALAGVARVAPRALEPLPSGRGAAGGEKSSAPVVESPVGTAPHVAAASAEAAVAQQVVDTTALGIASAELPRSKHGEPVRTAAPTSRRSRSPRAPVRVTLTDEIRMVDEVRQALSRGAMSDAFQALRTYERSGATGVLKEEALLLRIEALVGIGQRTRARGLATAFLDEHPQSAHKRRVESLLEVL